MKEKKRSVSLMGKILLLIMFFTMISNAYERTRIEEMKNEARVALVIGNGKYGRQALQNTMKDSKAIKEILLKKGFEVIYQENATQEEMKSSINEFLNKLKSKKGVGLFYYSGHGFEAKGENYLIPINANISNEISIKHSSIALNSIVNGMEASKNRLNIIVLDAGQLGEISDADGVFIACAADKGKMAEVGYGGNGLLTSSLLKYMNEEGLKIEEVFKLVRKDVRDSSNDRQIPRMLNSIYGDFYFTLPKVQNTQVATQTVQTTPTPQKIQKDTTPPTITITSPSSNRSLKKASESRIQIIGNATDTNGIAEVSVNGIMATLDAKGNFSSESLLRVGENNIVINATDTFGNIASKNITVERDGGVVASQKIDTTLGNVGKYKALLIGVDNYQDKNIKSLDNPIKDALALEKILKNDYGFETVVLKDPSRAEIIKSFDMIRKELSVNDSLIIFYAGHGYWDEEEKLGYWLPANAEKSNTAEWLPNSSIKDQLSRIQTKHTLLIADACFSGGIFKTRKAFDDNKVTSELFKLPSRKAMTSGTLKEVPDESVFIKYLLKRLKENEKKNLSAGTLFGSMRDAIISNNSLGLVPQYGEVNGAGDEGGDFIFMKR
jgi:uncharacterized caspase-like protein